MTFLKSSASTPLIRPLLQQDEWPETYLVRVARANGVRCPAKDTIDQIRHNTLQIVTNSESNSSGYFSELPTWATQKPGALIRYCPECFQKERYVRARWRITALEVCTQHDLRLKKGLFEPAVTSDYIFPEKRRMEEITDEQIWDGATCPMPNERAYATKIWAGFENAVTTPASEGSREALSWALLAERLLDAVVTAGYGPEFPLKGASRLSHRVHWLTNAGLRLAASQEGVLSFILSIKVHSERRAVAACLSSMINECIQESTILSTLPLQYLYDRLLAAAPEIYCPVAYGALPPDFHPDGYVSIGYAEWILGRSTGFVHYLVRANFFKKVHKVKFVRRVYIFIDRTEIEGCRRWLSGCMTIEQVKQRLQIDRSAYLTLYNSGLLQPIELGTWTLYRSDDIALLTNRLDDFAQPYSQHSTQLQPLMGNWLRRESRPRAVVIKILNEIWQGKVPIFRKLDEPGLSAFFVDAVAVMRTLHLSDVYHAQNTRERRNEGQLSLLEA